MIVLIIGFGSIGRRHSRILKRRKEIKKIFVLTKQQIPSGLIKCDNINDIKLINPDYIIIASETTKHFYHLKLINSIFKKKKILVEKPLYEKFSEIKFIKNKIFVGYNLRFHPIMQKIKNIVGNKTIYSINSLCLSHPKKWRKGRNYSKTSSATKIAGGGVANDLSHEFDFITWIFGQMKLAYSTNKKISNLKIQTCDYLSLNAKIKKNILVLINLNYFSKLNSRMIFIDGKNFSIKADLIKNSLHLKKDKVSKFYKLKKFKTDSTYSSMHSSIINNDFKNLCTYKEAIKVVKLIDQIKR